MISENDTITAVFENTLPYQEWMDTQILPALTIEDAMSSIRSIYG